MFYHGTQKECYENILKNGFQVIEGIKRRFGNGIYFSDQNNVNYYGNYVITANITENSIKHMTITQCNNLITQLIGRNNSDYSEKLKEHIFNLGYKALCIDYDGRGKELIVYDPNIIEIIKKSITAA